MSSTAAYFQNLFTPFSIKTQQLQSVLSESWEKIKTFDYSTILSNELEKTHIKITLGIIGTIFAVKVILATFIITLNTAVILALSALRLIIPTMILTNIFNKNGLSKLIIDSIEKPIESLYRNINENKIKNTLPHIFNIIKTIFEEHFMLLGGFGIGLTWALFSHTSLLLLVSSFFLMPFIAIGLHTVNYMIAGENRDRDNDLTTIYINTVKALFGYRVVASQDTPRETISFLRAGKPNKNLTQCNFDKTVPETIQEKWDKRCRAY